MPPCIWTAAMTRIIPFSSLTVLTFLVWYFLLVLNQDPMALQFTPTEPNNDRTQRFRSNLESCFFIFPGKHLSPANNLLWILKETSTKIAVGKACRDSCHTLPLEVNYAKQESLKGRPQLFTITPSRRKIFLLPSNKPSQWKCHSSANEKPSPPECLPSFNELSFSSCWWFLCPALLSIKAFHVV